MKRNGCVSGLSVSSVSFVSLPFSFTAAAAPFSSRVRETERASRASAQTIIVIISDPRFPSKLRLQLTSRMTRQDEGLYPVIPFSGQSLPECAQARSSSRNRNAPHNATLDACGRPSYRIFMST